MADEKKIIIELKDDDKAAPSKAAPAASSPTGAKEAADAPSETKKETAAAKRKRLRDEELFRRHGNIPTAERFLTEEYDAEETETGEIKWVLSKKKEKEEKKKKPPKPPPAPYFDKETGQWYPTKPPPLPPRPPETTEEFLTNFFKTLGAGLKGGTGAATGAAGASEAGAAAGGVTGAGAGGAGGAGMGAGGAAAAGGGAAAAGALMRLVNPVTIVAALFLTLAAATVLATMSAKKMAEDLKKYSAPIAMAKAQAEIREFKAKMGSARSVGRELAALESEWGDIRVTLIEMKTAIIKTLFPLMKTMLQLVDGILKSLKVLVIDLAGYVGSEIWNAIKEIIPGLKEAIADVKERENKARRKKEVEAIKQIKDFLDPSKVEKLVSDEEYAPPGFPKEKRGKL